jgi:hypothetical protein
MIFLLTLVACFDAWTGPPAPAASAAGPTIDQVDTGSDTGGA